jgi:hypothetical protein
VASLALLRVALPDPPGVCRDCL